MSVNNRVYEQIGTHLKVSAYDEYINTRPAFDLATLYH